LADKKHILKRRNYFVQKQFQLRFAAVIFLSMFSVVIAALFGVYLFNWKLISRVFVQREIYVNLYDIFKHANLALIVQLLILSFVMAAASIFISHKIAGPLYRLERNIRSLSNGDLTLISKLRKNDELKSLANSLDVLAEKFSEELRKDRKLLQEISASIEIIQNDLQRGKMSSQETQLGLSKIKKLIEELEENNIKFQLRQ